MNERTPLAFTIITGFSGAGKSEAIRCFEDLGYFCIDNLPPNLIVRLADLCSLPGSKIENVAVVSDVRGGEFFQALFEALRELKDKGMTYQIVFLEASDAVLVKRFKETRRRHPLAASGQVIEGIKEEKALLERLRGMADIVINTSEITAAELKDKIRSTVLAEDKQKGVLVTVISFGYKYGVPLDADIVMDVRFLPNPHYDKNLKPLTGEHQKVRDFVLKRPITEKFLAVFTSLLQFLMPHYITEGKTHLTIALGCTGGTHRSVALAKEVANFLKNEGYNAITRHRDVDRTT